MALHRSPARETPPPSLSSILPLPPESIPAVPVSWYDRGMTKVSKITVSLPQEQVEAVRDAVARGEAASVSGYVSAALADALARHGGEREQGGEDSLAELVAELIAEHGEPSAEAYAWADRVLALSDPD
jgi:Arc/MetJ-type ribon-helix-helix transcriptional regulator